MENTLQRPKTKKYFLFKTKNAFKEGKPEQV
jgi:hypothetical protein